MTSTRDSDENIETKVWRIAKTLKVKSSERSSSLRERIRAFVADCRRVFHKSIVEIAACAEHRECSQRCMHRCTFRVTTALHRSEASPPQDQTVRFFRLLVRKSDSSSRRAPMRKAVE